ncbi:MAG: hypothetical protein IK082_11040 [Oscillospiraceae bacterium]|nr:hypothetical protein [Oscillospiraceae bacterium]
MKFKCLCVSLVIILSFVSCSQPPKESLSGSAEYEEYVSEYEDFPKEPTGNNADDLLSDTIVATARHVISSYYELYYRTTSSFSVLPENTGFLTDKEEQAAVQKLEELIPFTCGKDVRRFLAEKLLNRLLLNGFDARFGVLEMNLTERREVEGREVLLFSLDLRDYDSEGGMRNVLGWSLYVVFDGIENPVLMDWYDPSPDSYESITRGWGLDLFQSKNWIFNN